MPATSMMSVTTPASLVDDGAGATAAPLALPLALGGASAGVATILLGERSLLLMYSDEGSRRIGVACLVRAMVREVLESGSTELCRKPTEGRGKRWGKECLEE